MPFGGFAPMPLRLGGTAQEGWAPEQHARMACDVAAMYGVKPLAVWSFTKSGATVTVTNYSGRNGVGTTFAPTAVVNGTGDITWTFPAVWTDDNDAWHPLTLKSARGTASTDQLFLHVVSCAGLKVRTKTTNASTNVAADGAATVIVKGAETRRREHYGGAPDKRASRAEHITPYAWGWYQFFQAARGSAYSTEQSGLVHAENLALARSEAALSRAAERQAANSIPSTSDERLAYWAKVQNVMVRESDLSEDVRARCKAKYLLAKGATFANVAAAVEALLGESFVQLWTQVGADLANPPPLTYWPGVNPGLATFDLGGGAWLSERSHIVVETQRTGSMTQAEYLTLMNTYLFDLLDNMLPSTCTFDWSEDLTAGFLLDVSQLDFVGITP